MITLVVATPFAVFGLPLVHALCREVPAQRAHVAVTAVVAFAEVFAVLVLFDGWQALVLGGSAGVGAAAGRAAVIPIVWTRRSAAPVGGRVTHREPAR